MGSDGIIGNNMALPASVTSMTRFRTLSKLNFNGGEYAVSSFPLQAILGWLSSRYSLLDPSWSSMRNSTEGMAKNRYLEANPETLVVPLPTARVSNHIRDPLPGTLRVLKRLKTG
jgi:hypothetical protein